MGGTIAGGKAAADTNKERYGSDWYAKIGAIGGAKKVPKGFALVSPEKHRAASARGGRKSRKNRETDN